MQSETHESGYSLVTEGIKVTVHPEHIEDGSDPSDSVFAFSYTIKIENQSSEPVQLLERHWIIISAGKHFAEVVGPGVVGLQPVLQAGEAFEYSSSAVIEDPIGSMHGSYTFRTNGGRYFPVEIPKFDLFYPVVIH